MIQVRSIDGKFVPIKFFTFSGGEESVKLQIPTTEYHIYEYTIYAMLESSQEIIQLLMVTNALKQYTKKIRLVCPYFPYARQDRIMTDGEALSVKVMADIINAQNYNSVNIWDAHSDVTPALINNLYHLTQDRLAYKMIKEWGFNETNALLVSPDAGANKKVLKLSQKSGMDFVRADKIRDVTTGQIKETKVYSEHVGDKDFIIVDDICDGGRTFIELAKQLRLLTNGSIVLYITHGIFSQGLNVFNGFIDAIYCPNVFSKVDRTKFQGFRWKLSEAFDN